MNLAVINRDIRAIINTEASECIILSFDSDIMNITVADTDFLAILNINCTDAAFIDVAVRDAHSFAGKSLYTDRTTSVETTCVYDSIGTVFQEKDAACTIIGSLCMTRCEA